MDKDKLNSIIIFTLFLILLFVIYIPTFYNYFLIAIKPNFFNDDVRQWVWPLYRYYDKSLFTDDYIANYFLACMPIGYKAIYSFASNLVHPRTFSKILPALLFFLTLVLCYLSATRLAGPFAGLGTLAIGLSSSQYFLMNTSGGLPRSFGFIAASAAIYALITKRHYLLSFITISSAAFYPPIAIISGLSLFFYMLLPKDYGGFHLDWSFKNRILLVFFTACISVIMIIPTYVSLIPYGASINFLNKEQLAKFPERLDRHSIDFYPRVVSLRAVISQSDKSIKEALIIKGNNFITYNKNLIFLKDIVFYFYLILSFIGLIFLIIHNNASRRLSLFILSVYVSCIFAVLLYPHLFYPSRYIIYSLPILMTILLPTSIGQFITISKKYFRIKYFSQSVLMLVSTVLFMFLLGSKGPNSKEFTVRIEGKDLQLYSLIETLSPKVTIAGWPSDDVMNNIPYYANRKVLLNFETHLCFHEEYALEMRRRWKILLRTYLNPNIDNLKDIFKNYGVTHLLFNKTYLINGKKLEYFASFSNQITNMGKIFNYINNGKIYEDDKYILFDIKKSIENINNF